LSAPMEYGTANEAIRPSKRRGIRVEIVSDTCTALRRMQCGDVVSGMPPVLRP